MKVQALDLMRELRNRHVQDVFLEEMSGASTAHRMDAWAMPRSWSKFTTIGYEIKVSRGDFLQDQKWHNYLGLCHEFYFVCPWGLIKPEELPGGCGLMYLTKTGNRLQIKRKAPRRQDADPTVMTRAIMRASAFENGFGGARQRTVQNRTERIAEMEQYIEDRHAGRRAAARLSSDYRRRITDAERTAKDAEYQLGLMRWVRDELKKIGIDGPVQGKWQVQSELDKIGGKLTPRLVSQLRVMCRTGTELLEKIDTHQIKEGV